MDPATRDATCFAASVAPVLGMLRGMAVRLSRDPHDADDLVQEAVLRAWRFWPRFKVGTNVRAWLARILTNAFHDAYARRRREREVLDQVRHVEADRLANRHDAPAVRHSLDDAVDTAIAALPSDFRSVLWLVAVDELSYREAATQLGCPVGTVMSRLHRARRSLRADLGGYAATHGYA